MHLELFIVNKFSAEFTDKILLTLNSMIRLKNKYEMIIIENAMGNIGTFLNSNIPEKFQVILLSNKK